MHEIHVSVVSPEEASYGTAEFWSGDRMIGFTRLEDGDLMFRVEPRHDGAAVVWRSPSQVPGASASTPSPAWVGNWDVARRLSRRASAGAA